MPRWLSFVLFLSVCCPRVYAQESTLYIQPPRSATDATQVYYHDLLQRMLPADMQIKTIPRAVTQERSLQLLNSNGLTVAWAGTNSRRESNFIPIRVPLFSGLLGVRMAVIRSEDKEKFDAISSSEQLKQLVACQGDQWPDSDILEANGYTVERVTKFDLMYRMLKAGRCDYFPRSITEIYGELKNRKDPAFMAYESILLSYPFPMYFFTGRDHSALAYLLEERLRAFALSGELKKYMTTHTATSPAFPLSRFKDARVFYLVNPDLPPATPVSDKGLWLMPPSEPGSERDSSTPALGWD